MLPRCGLPGLPRPRLFRLGNENVSLGVIDVFAKVVLLNNNVSSLIPGQRNHDASSLYSVVTRQVYHHGRPFVECSPAPALVG